MNILTFDIEEWFHILDNYSTKNEKDWASFPSRLEHNMERIFELLERKEQKATFFCLGWIAREYPEIIRRISDYGYEIATHSDLHQLAYEQNREVFKTDLEKSIKSIEDIIGKKVTTYRAPGFSVNKENKWVLEELVKHGIEIDCSIFPAKRAHGGFENYGYAEPSIIDIDGMKLKEFPISLFEFAGKNLIFSGGGYFRIFPYWMIKSMMKRSDYVMTCFHPRDFDPDQPIIAGLSKVRRFKSYVGLGTAFDKLERLITDFEFVDVNQADKTIVWNKQKIITL